MELFGATTAGKIKRAARLVSDAAAVVGRDANAARRGVEEAVALLRAVPDGTAELRAGLGDALSALGRIEWAANRRGRAAQLFEEAAELGAALTDDDIDHFAETAAESGRTDRRALEAYLAYAARRRAAAGSKSGAVYKLLEQACSREISSPSQGSDARSQLCSRAIDADARLGFPYYFRGRYAFAAGEYVAALDDFRRAASRGAGQPELSFYLVLCSAMQESRQGKMDAAAALYVEAARLNTGSFQAHLQAGTCIVQSCLQKASGSAGAESIDERDVLRAIALLQRACEIDDRSGSAQYELGRAHLLNQDPTSAVAALDRAVALSPGAGYFIEYARALRRAGSNAEAIAAAETALLLQPDLLSARKLIAAIAMREHDFARAIREYRSIQSARPPNDLEHRNALFNLGLCYFDTGNSTDAIRCFAALESQDLQLSREGRIAMARSHVRIGKLDLACARLKEIVAEEPGNGEAHYFLGCCLARQGRCEEAVEALNVAEGCGAEAGKAALQRGLALEALGRPDAARRSYESAIEQAGLPEARRRLARLCWTMGDRGQAVSHALKLAPGLSIDSVSPDSALETDPAYLSGIACLCAGDAAGALAAWQKLPDGPFRNAAIRTAALHAARGARDAGNFRDALANWDCAVEAGVKADLLRADSATAAAAVAVESFRSGGSPAFWKPFVFRGIELDREKPDAVFTKSAAFVLAGVPGKDVSLGEPPRAFAVRSLVSRSEEYADRGREAESAELLRIALQIEPGHAETLRIASSAQEAGPAARLAAGERRKAAEGWEREFLRYVRTNTAHNLANLYFWWAANESSLQCAALYWRKAIGFWALALNDAGYWENWSAAKHAAYAIDRAALSNLLPMVRRELVARIDAIEFSVAPEQSEIFGDLAMDCWAEFEIAAQLREAGAARVYGPLMMEMLGPPTFSTDALSRESSRIVRLGDCELPFIESMGDLIALCAEGHGRALAYLAHGQFAHAESLLGSKAPSCERSRLRNEMLAYVRICRAENTYIHLKCPPVSASGDAILAYADSVRPLIAGLAGTRDQIDSAGTMQALLRVVELLCRRTYNEFTSFEAQSDSRIEYLEAAVDIVDKAMELAPDSHGIEEARLYLAALLNLLALQLGSDAQGRSIELLIRAVVLAPDNPSYRRNLAVSYYNRYMNRKQNDSDREAAHEDIKRAHELAPFDADIQSEYQRLVGVGGRRQ